MAGRHGNNEGALAMALPAILGYGLDIALVSLAGWPGSSAAFSAGVLSSDAGSLFMQVKSASFCLSFFVWFALAMRPGVGMQGLLGRRWACWVFSALFVLGGLGSLAAVPHGMVGAVEAVCGLLMGVALAGNFTLWVGLFSALETPLDARVVIGGTAVGGLVYFMIAWLPSLAVCLVSLLVIAPGTSLLLMLCMRRLPGQGKAGEAMSAATELHAGAGGALVAAHSDGSAPVRAVVQFGGVVEYPVDVHDKKVVLKKGILALLTPHLAIGAIGAAMQMTRLLLVGLGSSELVFGNVNNLALIASGVIALVLFERSGYHIEMDVFARVGAPLIAAAALLLPVLGELYGYVLAFVLYAIFSWASIVGILACNQAARHYRIPPMALYSLMFGIIYTMRYLPSLLAGVFVPFSAPDIVQTLVCTLVCVAMMFCVYVVSDRYRQKQAAAQVFSWESQLEQPVAPHQETSEQTAGRLAQKFALTDREREIFSFLAKGRSVPVIAEQLGVSQNTVRFHCKNIYEKCGVHSKQELLSLMEEEAEGRQG